MAGENLGIKLRVEKIQMAEPIKRKEDLASVAWEDCPLTLRDDALDLGEDDPQEEVTYSHENDAPEDYSIAGSGVTLVGSFIKATRDQLLKYLGGEKAGAAATERLQKSAKKILLEKAIKITLKGGGDVVIPRAKGYVLLKASYGYGGVTKFPFKFKALQASTAWDCDIIM